MRRLSFLLLVLLVGYGEAGGSGTNAVMPTVTTVGASSITATAATQEYPGREAKQNKNIIWVKYRSTPVDLADPRFEYLDTSKSSFVTGAWYDQSKSYMIIGLGGTYYHYCRMPRSTWDAFRSADSFGKYFNGYIKGRYDCRLGGIPEYR